MALKAESARQAMEALGTFGRIDSWGHPQWCEGCPCGCGADTAYDDKRCGFRFRPGHDAKLVGKAVQAIRDGANGAEIIEVIESYGEFSTLAAKVRQRLLHFPKNGPTRKSARKLLKECGYTGSGESFVGRVCRRSHASTDHSTAVALGLPTNELRSYHVHGTDEDCAVWAVLNGMTRSRILIACS